MLINKSIEDFTEREKWYPNANNSLSIFDIETLPIHRADLISVRHARPYRVIDLDGNLFFVWWSFESESVSFYSEESGGKNYNFSLDEAKDFRFTAYTLGEKIYTIDVPEVAYIAGPPEIIVSEPKSNIAQRSLAQDLALVLIGCVATSAIFLLTGVNF